MPWPWFPAHQTQTNQCFECGPWQPLTGCAELPSGQLCSFWSISFSLLVFGPAISEDPEVTTQCINRTTFPLFSCSCCSHNLTPLVLLVFLNFLIINWKAWCLSINMTQETLHCPMYWIHLSTRVLGKAAGPFRKLTEISIKDFPL